MAGTTESSSQLSLESMSDEELLHLKFSDLKLSIPNSPLEECIDLLYEELEKKKLSFRPHCYLGDEWFSPDGQSAIALPFYLAHPRLKELEQKMMFEVEGGSFENCMKLLRHECGHALAHACQLMRRPVWRRNFGEPSQPYQDFYRFRPYSRSYVRHLGDWYAQSHPEEDFAETFAVWLNPDSQWQKLYRGWPALRKLEYVDRLCKRLTLPPPTRKKNRYPYQVHYLKRTLQKHYQQRRALYAEEDPAFFDEDLKTIFLTKARSPNCQIAARFIRKRSSTILHAATRFTPERKFHVQRLLRKLVQRMRILNLFVDETTDDTLISFCTYFTALVASYVYTNRYKTQP